MLVLLRSFRWAQTRDQGAEPILVRAVTTNSLSLLFLAQALDDLMDRGSTIFFFSSRGGRIVAPNYVAFGVGKAASEALMKHAHDDNPSGRAVQPSDCCEMIRFLASPAAEFIIGQVIFVNGGASLSA